MVLYLYVFVGLETLNLLDFISLLSDPLPLDTHLQKKMFHFMSLIRLSSDSEALLL